jgi:uncharacterized low-complexity protein
MNLWIIAAVFVGILAIAGVAVVNALPESQSIPTTNQKTCSSCGNSCTAESNCGLSTCGATNGGTCGCGK